MFNTLYTLHVFDETASIKLLIEQKNIQDIRNLRSIKNGSVISIYNGATILDMNGMMNLVIPSRKYSKIQVYNNDSEDPLCQELSKFCDDIQEDKLALILLKNMSIYKLKIKTI